MKNLMSSSLVKAGAAILSIYVIKSIYDNYNKNELEMIAENDNVIIKDYLLKDIKKDKLKKPILWIHIPYEKNSRSWDSFYSRSNEEINQPYIYFCVKSIIDKCGKSFHVCIIDDNSFEKLLPNWNIDMNKLSNPILENMRVLGLMKLIYNYGGLNVPYSFVCYKDLITLYNSSLSNPFFGELRSKSIVSNICELYPTYEFMGCEKENDNILEIIKLIEITISNKASNQIGFDGTINKLLYQKIIENKATLIDGSFIGSKKENNKALTIEDLFSEEPVIFKNNIYGIYLPYNEILLRNKYNWYCRSSIDECINGDLNIHFIIKRTVNQYL